MNTISLEQLNAADQRGFAEALGNIFEHAPWVAEIAARKRPFHTIAALADAMQQAVQNATQDQKLALIAGHPDLANKAVKLETLTTKSQAEQTGAGLDRLSAQEFDRFHRLNADYRNKFGIPFIICVRRHSKRFHPDPIRAEAAQRAGSRTQCRAAGNFQDRQTSARSAYPRTGPAQCTRSLVHARAGHLSRPCRAWRGGGIFRNSSFRRNPPDLTNHDQRGRAHRSTADRGTANSNFTI